MFNNNNVAGQSKEIDEKLESYTEIKQWREQHLITVSTDHQKLNTFHDELFKKTIQAAVKKVQSERGDPPAPFAFFLMGSAGRFEQSIWSDQDHGIIYDGSDNCEAYFLALGNEIKHGLTVVGYEQCDGNVMASNPLWCQSIKNWETQISNWLNKASWQSLRHFLTFFDSRVLIGEVSFLKQLKEKAFFILKGEPHLYIRLVENVDFIKKGVGAFGQLLPELHGAQTGSIHLKQTAFFPYVNSLRLLALKEEITAASTISRFRQLPESYTMIKDYEKSFIQLLDFRLDLRKSAKSYQEVHLIPLNSLVKTEKQELKQLMKRGYKLFSETKKIIENECSI